MNLKKITGIAVAVTVLFASCGPAVKKDQLDRSRPSVTVLFSFNPESYPRFVKKAYPQMAVWVTQNELKFQETIYATRAGSEDRWWGAEVRPSALPVWYGVRKADPAAAYDSVTGATPSGESYKISWNIPDNLKGKEIDIYIEANVSFDYNENFPEKAVPGDPLYSDVNGQPSLVWIGRIKAGDKEITAEPEIGGHGHLLGKDHRIYSDISKITTAKGLFHYIKIIYEPANAGK